MGVQVIGDDVLVAKFRAADAALRASERDWLHEAGVIVLTAIEANIVAQGLVESGDLAGSGRVFAETAHGSTVGFGQGLDYAASLENGSVSHVITSSSPWGLYFSPKEWVDSPVERNAAGYVNLNMVTHPGNRPYKFMRNGAEASMPALIEMFKVRLRAIFGGSL